jgi:hypothetical protein
MKLISISLSSSILAVLVFSAIMPDFTRQIAPAHGETWNYGNSKGWELIPARRIELIFNVPPYIQHNTRTGKDGFGRHHIFVEVSFLRKQ